MTPRFNMLMSKEDADLPLYLRTPAFSRGSHEMRQKSPQQDQAKWPHLSPKILAEEKLPTNSEDPREGPALPCPPSPPRGPELPQSLPTTLREQETQGCHSPNPSVLAWAGPGVHVALPKSFFTTWKLLLNSQKTPLPAQVSWSILVGGSGPPWASAESREPWNPGRSRAVCFPISRHLC